MKLHFQSMHDEKLNDRLKKIREEQMKEMEKGEVKKVEIKKKEEEKKKVVVRPKKGHATIEWLEEEDLDEREKEDRLDPFSILRPPTLVSNGENKDVSQVARSGRGGERENRS